LEASPVAQAAEALGLPVFKPDHPRDRDFLATLRALEPDAVATVAYGALLPGSALAIPRYGWINLHFSLLPAWRGAAPVQRAVWAGDEITGATTFQIVEALDSGPVYGVVTYEMPPRATSGEVLEALAADGAGLLTTTLDLVASGAARPQPQTGEGLSYAPKVTVEEAQVDWHAPAIAVDRQIRACTPAPGAWTTFRGQRLKIGPLAAWRTPSGKNDPKGCDSRPEPAPGTVVTGKRDVVVKTATGFVTLGRVAPAGRSWMDAAAWTRGVQGGQPDNDEERFDA
jgi:methionyl-tRNA formyltransferase